MNNRTFNLYCDESTHLENDGFPYMIIAYVSSPWNEVKLHSQHIFELREKHHYKGEIKWSKISASNHTFYSELIDYFFATDLNFRAVIVKKSQIQKEVFGLTYNDFYYRMYYQLLNHKINMEYTYNIYLDIKDTCSFRKIRKLREILNIQYGNIRNLQFIHSHESVLLQMTDVIMGALNYYLREERAMTAKLKLIDKIQKHAKRPLDCTSPGSSDKFNLFFIELK